MGWWWWYLFTDSTCDYKFVISVDIAEGLGIDYSIINIFKIGEKPKELTEIQKPLYKSMSDFFRLDQVGLFRVI
jgi:hypothetical protein